MNKKINPGKLFGRLVVPPSKSDAQRAILAASLAKGTSQIYNIGSSDDERAMLRNIQALGTTLEERQTHHAITGGKQATNVEDKISLNVGESGLGLRLLAAICASLRTKTELTGEGSIMNRPQSFFEEHLTQLGVKVVSNNGKLPIELHGTIKGGKLEIDGSVSSQFLSGLLMALPLLSEDSELTVRNLKSIPYVRMTLATLNSFGIKIDHERFERFKIKGNQHYVPTKYAIESDWSSASYWLVASSLGHDVKCVGLSLDSYQADKAILDAFVAANCVVAIDEEGVKVDGTQRHAFAFDATHSPDLFPALVAFATFCEGTSRISGVHRLRHKESDRASALVSEFSKLGVQISIEQDAMVITGVSDIGSSTVDSHNDHRIAMCLAIAGLNSKNGLEVKGAEAVSKSYPEFWKDLEALTIQ